MIGTAQIQSESVEQYSPDWEQLKQENGSLRSIIAELLIKNQNLRWELLGHCCGPAQDSRLLKAFERPLLGDHSLATGIP